MRNRSLAWLSIAFVMLSFTGEPDHSTIIDFIVKDPARFSILFTRNDTVIASWKADTVLPLASTVKITIAIEYAYQAAEGKIDPDEPVSLDDLAKYHVPNTDGGGHESWLGDVRDKIRNGKIPLREVASGMITRSSNANTEWLLGKLGVENVNARIRSLGMPTQTPVYYLVSALFIGKEAFPLLRGKPLQLKLAAMDGDSYRRDAMLIHEKLSTDSLYKKNLGELSLDIQKVISNRLPSASARDYHTLMQKFNSRKYFPVEVHKYLDEVMEFLLTNPANAAWLAHAGMKGGSTAFVLSKALYATDKKGNRTELVYFMHDLKPGEAAVLANAMNDFELNVLTSGAFRQELKAAVTK